MCEVISCSFLSLLVFAPGYALRHRTMAANPWASAKAAGQNPLPRTLHTATPVMAKIFILGGKDTSGNTLPMELYNLNTGTAPSHVTALLEVTYIML